jgi:tetrapyrrole methylase family protein/MazG family protein
MNQQTAKWDLFKLEQEATTSQEALGRLISIVKILREECPWDREQTHESLRSCLLEEAYEVVDAINHKDDDNLEEELGDVLLQVVLHGILGAERNKFDFTTIANLECEKMIRRHPHVFLKEKVDSIDKALEKWENVKRKEREDTTHTHRLQAVPSALPALIRSYKLQARAAEAGFDWAEVSGAFQKLEEELSELREATEGKDPGHMAEELGDLIFSAVNVARFLGVNPEEALNATSEKFVRRFSEVEQGAKAIGKRLEDMSLEEMDVLWEQAKNSGNIK